MTCFLILDIFGLDYSSSSANADSNVLHQAPYPCPFCKRLYTSWGFRRRHIKAVHNVCTELPCKWCSTIRPSPQDWKNHIITEHRRSLQEARLGLKALEEAHTVLQAQDNADDVVKAVLS